MGARRRLFRLTALLLLVVLLSGCGGTAIDLSLPELPPVPAAQGLRVAVASDLHLNPDYTESSEGDAAAYSLELTDALLRDVREQGAQLLLLTGDLVNGGKENRHEALLEKLRGAEAAGLAVYVLPGNHDLAPSARRSLPRSTPTSAMPRPTAGTRPPSATACCAGTARF